MQVSMPNMPETLAYAVVAAVGIDILVAILIAATGPHDLVAALLVLAVAGAVYWCIGRNLVTIVSAKEVAATAAILLAVCGLADLAVGYPYHGILFILGAAALGFVFLLLQQGTIPFELRLGGVVAIASSSRLALLRMLDELRAAGLLTPEEYAAKRLLVGP